ncbi:MULTISPECIES: SusC/RagA family TonB-linked outer membrane protein [unclassified Flavobacterium]|uniref:SusC/RagA family TonB-linked outer membrane protein n=1 Tax=unclassified Flavobacterium TaxID=196869 RepID=UPI00131CEFB9|nr:MULTISPECIES: SusC/RagA family TonB-linked outer membrane protein [unclassified Flavobacterium]
MNFRHLLKKGSACYVAFFLLLSLFTVQEMKAQQPSSVTGTITDAAGLTLPGVNVVEKGTRNTASTDLSGNFTIKLTNEKAVLQISFVGFVSQEVNVTGKETIKIALVEESQSLKEVVVVGYGKVKKSDLTGAATTLDAKALTERAVTNAVEALQGNVAGVQISTSTGRIGDKFQIAIRGKSTYGDATPLFVVDGVLTDGIDFLNPQDIARIDVLKDASSTAIYGSRGSNGVVIVTTKSGSTAKKGMTVTFDSFLGIKEVARMPKFMDGPKWFLYHQSAFITEPNVTTPATLETAVVGTQNTLLRQRVNNNETYDWVDGILQSGIQKNNYLSISGLSGNGIGYNLGLGVQNETGSIANESLDKYNFKAGITNKVNEQFNFGVNTTIAVSDQQQGSAVAMREAFRLSPYYLPYDSSGQLTPTPGRIFAPGTTNTILNKTTTYNPFLEIQNTSDETRRWNGIMNVFLEYKPLQWLTFKTNYSGNYDSTTRGRSWGPLTNTGTTSDNKPSGELTKTQRYIFNWDNQFNINYTIKKHAFNFLGLQSIYSNTFESAFQSSRNLLQDTGYYNLGFGLQSTFNLSNTFSKETLASFAGRLNYSYNDRYLLTVSNRWDGSSKFAKGNQWSSFPSAAIAWKINEESFLRNVNQISQLKARVSYGFTGNNNIDAYSSQNLTNLQTFYDFNGVLAYGLFANSLYNPNITWEKNRELNLGLDFGLFQNRISGTVDVYDRLSKDLLFRRQLPRESGWAYTNDNVGSVSNKGIEVLLTTKNIKTSNVQWETTFIFNKNTNKIKSIYGQDQVSDVVNNLFIGQSIDVLYNFQFDGIWQPNQAAQAAVYGQAPGQARVVDINNDGRITPEDRTFLGNTNPDWSGSITSRLTYKNFDFTVSAFTNQGVLAFSQFHQNFTDLNDRGRQKLDIDWYIPENTEGLPVNFSNEYPFPRNEGTYWRDNGVGYYKDASFIKIKNINFGYTLNKEVSKKIGLSDFRIYANVLNPFVFTKYEGYDPEWASAGFNVSRVSTITYQLGLSVKF